jgi:hypothetical protein
VGGLVSGHTLKHLLAAAAAALIVLWLAPPASVGVVGRPAPVGGTR